MSTFGTKNCRVEIKTKFTEDFRAVKNRFNDRKSCCSSVSTHESRAKKGKIKLNSVCPRWLFSVLNTTARLWLLWAENCPLVILQFHEITIIRGKTLLTLEKLQEDWRQSSGCEDFLRMFEVLIDSGEFFQLLSAKENCWRILELLKEHKVSSLTYQKSQ